MSILPPSPFCSAAFSPSAAVAPVVASNSAPDPDAAAGPSAESSMSTGGHQEATLAGPPNNRPASGLLDDDHRFVLDEAAFLNDLEPLPAFLSAPSQEYLKANELMSVLHALARH